MARKTAQQPVEDREEDAALRGSRADAVAKINDQIEKGKELVARPIQNTDQYSQLCDELHRWDARNEQLLAVLFTNSALKSFYHHHGMRVVFSMYETPLHQRIEDTHEDIGRKINTLQSILDRIDLFPEGSQASAAPTMASSPAKGSSNVFIVHGHDLGARDSVARFIQALKLNPVILDEQANQGKTIIEKFEQHADDGVGFAVVVITPDDVGGVAGTDAKDLKPRARQNIIFELGYFFGRLGRQCVVALYQSGIELPSDIAGVLYVPFDNDGTWKVRLAKEMKVAGLAVDLNDAL